MLFIVSFTKTFVITSSRDLECLFCEKPIEIEMPTDDDGCGTISCDTISCQEIYKIL